MGANVLHGTHTCANMVRKTRRLYLPLHFEHTASGDMLHGWVVVSLKS